MSPCLSILLLASVATNVFELSEIQRRNTSGDTFAFRAKVMLGTLPNTIHIYVKDDSGHGCLSCTNQTVRAGDIVDIRGHTLADPRDLPNSFAWCDSIEVVRHTEPEPPVKTTPEDIANGHHLGKVVQVEGMIQDAFVDEISPQFYGFILRGVTNSIYVAACAAGPVYNIRELIGARMQATGFYMGTTHNVRIHIGPTIYSGAGELLTITQPPDNAAIPDLDELARKRPDQIAAARRHRTRGIVLAVWNGDTALLLKEDGKICRAEFIGGGIPRAGDTVEVTGLPETDLYRINLTRATWRPVEVPNSRKPREIGHRLRTLVYDKTGRLCINSNLHGSTIRFDGIVRGINDVERNGRHFYLESGGVIVKVLTDACPELMKSLEIGSRVEVHAVYVNDLGSWSANAPIPKIKGVFFVMRGPDDLIVLSRPPWWTPLRLLMVIGILLLALSSVFLWNLALRRLAERRGRALAAENLAHAEADIKTEERTRLAVELHDSVAQNLTGIAMEMEAARQYQTGSSPELLKHLDVAWRTLRSCRAELRNCLWDLRSRALDEPDLASAVRRTLLPLLKGVTLSVRIAIPRETLTENTSHSVLRSIRELTANAINHGGATHIKIAGAYENGKVLFSVKDNGSGFDPDLAPGITLGHFGLEGVRERMLKLGGTFEIQSVPGHGARAMLTLNPPKQTE